MVRAQQGLLGVVVVTRSFEESSRILEAVTPEHGRVSLLARGARASKRRFAGALDPFTTLRMQVSPRGALWTLDSCDVLTARPGIRARYELIERASRLCDCARALTNAEQAAPGIYEALTAGLDALDRGELAAAALAYGSLLTAAGILADVRELGQEVSVAQPLSEARAVAIEDAALDRVEAHLGRPLKSRQITAPSAPLRPRTS